MLNIMEPDSRTCRELFEISHRAADVDREITTSVMNDSTGYSNHDILRRIGLASSVMGQLDRGWRQNRLSLATRPLS